MTKPVVLILALVTNATLAFAQVPSLPSSVPTSMPKSMPTEADVNAAASADSAAVQSQANSQSKSLLKEANAKAVVHLNSASVEDLQKLPGIGPERAKAIIAARPFKSVADLKNVKGIKEAVYAKIKNLVKL